MLTALKSMYFFTRVGTSVSMLSTAHPALVGNKPTKVQTLLVGTQLLQAAAGWQRGAAG
jgi:hypothetical protein